MAKNITMSDLAKELHVSTVTVSKALANQRGVSREMKEQILSLARERGYMKTEKVSGAVSSHTIGVIVAERYLAEAQSFYWKLYQELSQLAIARNCFTFLEVISPDTENREELPKIILDGKAEGLIVMGAFSKNYASYIAREVSIPLLYLDTVPASERCDAVVSDNLTGGCLMTDYLFSLGHSDIGFVGTRLATTSIDDRFLGYIKSMMEHGRKIREEWIVDDRARGGTVDPVHKLQLPEGNMPTAFFCNCDLAAYALIKKLALCGLRVPDDISVVGFDNYITGEADGSKITTYEIDMKEMAKRAVHTILHKIEDRGYSTGVFVLAGTFIERMSAKKAGPPVPFA